MVGHGEHPNFTDDTAACTVWSEAINVMLITHVKWRTFTSRLIPPATSIDVMIALSCDSRDVVDAIGGAAAEGVPHDEGQSRAREPRDTARTVFESRRIGRHRQVRSLAMVVRHAVEHQWLLQGGVDALRIDTPRGFDSKARLGVRRTMSPKTLGSDPLRAQYREDTGHHSRLSLGAHRRA